MTGLKFDYTNWKGEDHTYVIGPEKTITYDVHHEDPEPSWQLHGQVVTRDGDPRKDMDPYRRRSFKISGMRNIEEIPVPEMI